MVKPMRSPQRREASLSRERIIDVAITLLDRYGEDGLTFRVLSEALATGPGAIYWHIANKGDLMMAACDAIVAQTMAACAVGEADAEDPEDGRRASAKAGIRRLALALFDTIDVHAWLGGALVRAAGQLPMVRILESIGQQIRSLDVPQAQQWPAVSALLSYILGVSGQNAANAQLAQAMGANRSDFLDGVSAAWAALDAEAFPFTRSVAAQLPAHDDRDDFLAGIDFILAGIERSVGA